MTTFQYAVFVHRGRPLNPCLRVGIGAELTYYIPTVVPLDAQGKVQVRSATHEQFREEFAEAAPHGLHDMGKTVALLQQIAAKVGCTKDAQRHLDKLSDVVRTVTSMPEKENRMTDSVAPVSNSNSKNSGVPAEKQQMMQAVGDGAMAIIAKHNPESATARALAQQKHPKGTKGKSAQKAAPKKAAANTTQRKEATMAKSKGKTSKKAAAKQPKKVAAAHSEEKFVVAKDNTREGTQMKVMMTAAAKLKKFTRDELVSAIKRQLTEERARRFFSWALGHDLFKLAK